MNRVNFVYLFAILCVLVSPSLTAPADDGSPEIEQEPPNPSANEIGGELGDDVETFKPAQGSDGSTDVDNEEPTYSGVSTGIISMSGVNGTFECRNITGPEGTETCKFTSRIARDGKTAQVHYQCFSSDGGVLLDETKTEDASDGFISIDSFFSEFTRRMSSFLDDILKSFQY